MSERTTLESEVMLHRVRVAELGESLRALEDSLQQTGSHPAKILRDASLLRLEMQGREAAVQIGSARLKMLRE
jgi:hypothetical protein